MRKVVRAVLINSLLLITSTVIALCLLEQATRFYLFGFASFDKARMSSIVPVTLSGFMQASPFTDVYSTLKPNQAGWFKLARFQTNADGQADEHTYALEKPDGVYRIIVLGDSYSMASGVDTDKSYHALLEKSLNQRGDPLHYEIINFAVGGYNLEQYTAVLEHVASQWQPDEIWIGFCVFNDFIKNDVPFAQREPFNPWTANSYTRSFVIETWQTWERARAERASHLTISGEVSDASQAFINAEFSKIGAQAAALHATVRVIFLDNRPYPVELINNMQGLAQQHGFGFIDVTQAFEGTDLLDYSIYPLDGHPNEAAHQRFADVISEHWSNTD